MTDWPARYLQHLELSPEPPSHPSLARLTRQHLRRVPFENFSTLSDYATWTDGARPAPDPERWLARWKQGAAGGVCFHLAPLLQRLLLALGYDATLITGSITAPGSHQALVVRLEGREFLVDGGTAAPFVDPIPTDEQTEIAFGQLRYRFRPGEQERLLVQERWIQGAWAAYCRYDLQPATAEALEASPRFHLTPGNSWLLGSLTLVHCTDEAVYAARDEQLILYTRDGQKETTPIARAEDWEELARERMHLPRLPVRAALAVRADLDRPISSSQ